MNKYYSFIVEGEEYYMTMEELVENITRSYAKELLSAEDFEFFCKEQDIKLERI